MRITTIYLDDSSLEFLERLRKTKGARSLSQTVREILLEYEMICKKKNETDKKDEPAD